MSGRRSRIQVRPNVGVRSGAPKKTDSTKTDNEVKMTIPDVSKSEVSAKSSPQTSLPQPAPPLLKTVTKEENAEDNLDSLPVTNSHELKHDKSVDKIQEQSSISEQSSSPSVKNDPVPASTGSNETKVVDTSDSQACGSDKKPVAKPSISRRSRFKPQVQIRRNKPSAVHDEKETKITNLTDKSTDEGLADKSPGSHNTLAETTPVISTPAIIVVENVSQSNSITEQTEDVHSKSPTKRGRFAKARPNVVEAERRRARLSSFSEHEESPSIRKHRTAVERESISGDVPDEGGDKNRETRHAAHATSEVTECRPQEPKVKRKMSVNLTDLVSENRHKLTVRDLIHMNPVHNPMKRYLKPDTPEPKNKDQTPQHSDDDEGDEADGANTSVLSPRPGATPLQSPKVAGTPAMSPRAAEAEAEDVEETQEEAMPVPQIMIGPDGQIMLNDASLVVANPAHQPDTVIEDMEVVEENDNYDPSFYYRKRTRSIWDMKDTLRFYVALSTVGTDFSLMGNLFPKRNRTELKRKFKLEEKKHKELVDYALENRRELDLSIFEPSDDEDSDTALTAENPENKLEEAVTLVYKKEMETNSKKGTGKKATVKTTKKKPSAKSEKEETVKKDKKSMEKKPKPKGKRRKKANKYYDSSSSEDESNKQVQSKKSTVNKTTDDHAMVDNADNSGDESCTIERVVAKKTRVGRQPKRPQTYEPPLTEAKRQKKTEINTPQSPFTSPLHLPSRDVTQKVIEDKATGQRLLLVKSPPPRQGGAQGEGGDFVHVYLLSPSPQRKPLTTGQDTAATTQQNAPQAFVQGHSSQQITPQRNPFASNDAHIKNDSPRSVGSSHDKNVNSPHGDQAGLAQGEETIIGRTPTRTIPQEFNLQTNNIQAVNTTIATNPPSGNSESEIPAQTRENITEEYQILDISNRTVNTTCTPTDGIYPPADPKSEDQDANYIFCLPQSAQNNSEMNEPVHTQAVVTNESQLIKAENSDSKNVQAVFDNAEITTITGNDGEIVEIIIEPSMLGLGDSEQSENFVVNVPVIHQDSMPGENNAQEVLSVENGHGII